MDDHQISLSLDDDTKLRLAAEAEWQSQTEAEVASDAIKTYLARQSQLRKSLEAASIEADKGIFISSEAMMRWVKDLFDGKKTPPPEPDVFLPPRTRP